MIRSNDVLRRHPAFLSAARGAISILLSLHEAPYTPPSSSASSAEGTEGLSEEERRKAEKKAKKAEAKAKAAAAAANGSKEDEAAVKEKEDEDPTGEKAWMTRSPLEDAKPWLTHLEALGPDVPEAQELIARVALKQSESPPNTVRAGVCPELIESPVGKQSNT